MSSYGGARRSRRGRRAPRRRSTPRPVSAPRSRPTVSSTSSSAVTFRVPLFPVSHFRILLARLAFGSPRTAARSAFPGRSLSDSFGSARLRLTSHGHALGGTASVLHARDLGQTGVLQRLADAIADPLQVPPLHRRHRHAADQRLEVDVIADGQPGGAAAPELLSLGDGVAD